MEKKLAIIALGQPNSGKSTTWYELIGRKIRSGLKRVTIDQNELLIFFKNSSPEETGKEISIDVFIRNASFEEYGDEVGDYFNDPLPNIVCCSVQYVEKGVKTLEWFKENGYYLYIHWINPGYNHQKEYNDFLNFEDRFGEEGTFLKFNGKEKNHRVSEIKKFLASWTKKIS